MLLKQVKFFTPRAPETDQEKLNWLRLIRTENIGPITFFHLLNRFKTAEKALQALPELAKRGGKIQYIPYPESKAYEEIEAHQKYGATLVFATDPDYPLALQSVADRPPVLSFYGNRESLKHSYLAIVGARNASLNGKNFTKKLTQDLTLAGWKIVSGLARGIDTQAHESALAQGTLAIIAGGVDKIYPPENTALYYRIRDSGGILSEAPFGTEPQARHFPRRNRIISGISQGVIVIEAGYKSGSLITAQSALEQGREVFAVPGSPLDPRCHGSNSLLQQGATLVQTATDVLEHLPPLQLKPTFYQGVPQETQQLSFALPESESFPDRDLNSIRKKVLENLGPSPVLLEELIDHCDLNPAAVYEVMLELELAGHITRSAGNKVSLIMKELSLQ